MINVHRQHGPGGGITRVRSCVLGVKELFCVV